jgi:tetratricopeptide (TPR) repeat protein
MLRPQKKITKREIKKDPLITWYAEAREWFENHQKLLSYVGLGVLALAVAGWVYYNNKTQAENNATTDLGKVLTYYDKGQYELAVSGVPQENIRGLQSIVDEYDGTSSGEKAQFLLANAYYNLKQYDKALENFKGTDMTDPVHAASVSAGEAACYEAMGNYQEAGSLFEKAASVGADDLLSSEYLYDAARNLIKSGGKEKARELLKKLKKDYPTSVYAREAELLLAQANA